VKTVLYLSSQGAQSHRGGDRLGQGQKRGGGRGSSSRAKGARWGGRQKLGSKKESTVSGGRGKSLEKATNEEPREGETGEFVRLGNWQAWAPEQKKRKRS